MLRFDVLRTMSQAQNRKLGDVAIELVEQMPGGRPKTADERDG